MILNHKRKVAGIMLKDKENLLSENLFEDVPDETEDSLENEISNMIRDFVDKRSINEITQNLWGVAIKEDGLNPAQATDRTLTEMANFLLYSKEDEIMIYKELINLNEQISYDDREFGFLDDEASNVKKRVLGRLNRKGREAQAALKARNMI